MQEQHLPSPTTYALRRSLRDQLPHSNPLINFDEMDFLTDENAPDEAALIRKLDAIDRHLQLNFRTRVNGVLIDTRPIYYSVEDAEYETGIFGDGEEKVPVVMHGTDPDVQTSAVRKAQRIHNVAVLLAEQGYDLQTIYRETLRNVA